MADGHILGALKVVVPPKVDAYLEVGSKRVFAGALEWPGWCRSGKTEDAALESLADYGPRYVKAIGQLAKSLQPPGEVSGLKVVERLKGNATTDFGAPGKAPKFDNKPVDAEGAKRLAALMKAVWAKFDKTVESAQGVTLSKGPRGGGRELQAMVEHVLGAEISYLYRLGRKFKTTSADVESQIAEERKTFLETLAIRARGEEAEPPGRRTAKLWTARYAVRRAAWHVLDHAWEIEDRSET